MPSVRPPRTALLVLLLLVVMSPVAAAAEHPALATARVSYNSGDYDGAIEAAATARLAPEAADAALVVLARAHLERHRRGADPADLAAARQALRAVQASALADRDRVDLLVALGQSLYLGEMFGAAGELFETALAQGDLLEARDRLLLLDWWATALDREAQTRQAEYRTGLFARIETRMLSEVQLHPESPTANYWLSVAARGLGDVEYAWDTAVAGWIRAGFAEGGERVRADLDRLVTQALIPERARARLPRDQDELIAVYAAEWALLKAQWP
ncbi:MAG: hypothetical protein AB7G23_17975 [Vicinamibacterales bacterium]